MLNKSLHKNLCHTHFCTNILSLCCFSKFINFIIMPITHKKLYPKKLNPIYTCISQITLIETALCFIIMGLILFDKHTFPDK